MPSLKDQVNGWINEEVRFIESGQYQAAIQGNMPENLDKIHTSLSVAKLAVIIRLLELISKMPKTRIGFKLMRLLRT